MDASEKPLISMQYKPEIINILTVGETWIKSPFCV
jgi:hypothetical protein